MHVCLHCLMHCWFKNTCLGKFPKLIFFTIFVTVVQSESSKVSFLFLCCQSWLNFVILFSIQRAGWPTCRCLDWKWNHFTRSIALHFYLNSLHISNGNVKNIVKLPWHQNWEYCFCSGSGWHSWNRPVCLASSFFRANVLKFCTKKS